MKLTHTQSLLFSHYQNHTAAEKHAVLWVLDESSELLSHKLENDVDIMSNRYDIVAHHKKQNAILTDFDFTLFKNIQHIYCRIAKEKALVHYIINEAYKLLPPNGELILAGEKNEGIKSYAQKAKSLFGNVTINKDKNSYLVILTKNNIVSEINKQTACWLDDQHYTNHQIIYQSGIIDCYSKPGVFGWNKVDQGSSLLIKTLKSCLENKASNSLVDSKLQESINKSNKTLDLGCGWGYLSFELLNLGFNRIYATDNNITAIKSIEKTCVQNNVNSLTVWTDDCGSSCEETFELIVCNPPFHQGFDHVYDLTEKFLVSAKRLLSKAGIAIFVVNQFLPLEQKSQSLFKQCDLLSEADGFKVYCLSNKN